MSNAILTSIESHFDSAGISGNSSPDKVLEQLNQSFAHAEAAAIMKSSGLGNQLADNGKNTPDLPLGGRGGNGMEIQ